MNAETRRTTDHDTIQTWAEKRAGVPASERGTGSEDETGVLAIDFPGDGGTEDLEYISWEEWFRKFDQEKLCFLYQEERASGEESTFFKLIARTG